MVADGLVLARQGLFRLNILVLVWGLPRRLSLMAFLDGCTRQGERVPSTDLLVLVLVGGVI